MASADQLGVVFWSHAPLPPSTLSAPIQNRPVGWRHDGRRVGQRQVVEPKQIAAGSRCSVDAVTSETTRIQALDWPVSAANWSPVKVKAVEPKAPGSPYVPSVGLQAPVPGEDPVAYSIVHVVDRVCTFNSWRLKDKAVPLPEKMAGSHRS